MTPEEKAKRYDEILEQFKDLIESTREDKCAIVEEDIIGIFPELNKESKDEIIRQKFIKLVKMSSEVGGFALHKWEAAEMLAWLEKQGESIKIKKGKNYLCTKTHKYAGVEWIEGVKYYSPEDYSLVNQGCKYYCPKYSKKEHNDFFKEVEYDGCLDKQDEQKVSYTTLVETGNGGINALDTRELPTNCDSIYCSGCINKKGCINCENGDMKETEHKVEPNFHEGDWVVYNNDICQIVKREEGCNKLVTVFGIEKELVNERNLSTAHLWTIQDAKDGDVLAAHECLVLFKKLDGLNIRCYCTYHFMNNTSFYVDTLQNKDAFHPATKEQCDTLMKAISDAGYAFDFEKKELKKIEDEEYSGEDYGIDSLFHAQRILEKTLGKVDGYQTDDGILSHKCAITAVKKLYGQKPAEWSKEDEEMLDNAVYACLNIYGKDSDTVDWLKSLKPRIGV